jgi:hypothetical protein
MHTDLTAQQKDYAVFLPALSSFYARDLGKARHEKDYILPQRIPANFEHGIEGMNYLVPTNTYFHYRWHLYSAGHADLNMDKFSARDDIIRNRDRKTSFVLGDSGGFQIGKGVWEGNWKDPTCPRAKKKREQVLAWMDANMNYGMILDIPAWVSRSPEGAKASNINTYQEAVDGTRINNDYFMKNRTGACKFLNVLQGENFQQADDWYQQMKDYCDPKKYPTTHFNGWAMGGQNMCDVHLILKRLVALRFDGLLEKGVHDWMHFLGTSKLEWAVLLTDIQRAVRKYHNPNFTVSFDCASPFLASANGQIYTEVDIKDREKWSYRMAASIDDKKYAGDTRPFKDAVLQEKIFDNFQDSPISKRLLLKDITCYAPGDKNKVGGDPKTSWDSFSYTLQMAHNVWTHINAVQEANRQYDAGLTPRMLIEEKFDKVAFKDIVEAVFATDNRDTAEAVIEEYSRFWMSIIGTRGATGKKTVNASTQFSNLFEEV